LAGRSKPPADQSQPKSVPAQAGKEIFKNAPGAIKREQNNEMDRQIRTYLPVDTVDIKEKRIKSTMPQQCV